MQKYSRDVTVFLQKKDNFLNIINPIIISRVYDPYFRTKRKHVIKTGAFGYAELTFDCIKPIFGYVDFICL
jgi:hypothetical protein